MTASYAPGRRVCWLPETGGRAMGGLLGWGIGRDDRAEFRLSAGADASPRPRAWRRARAVKRGPFAGRSVAGGGRHRDGGGVAAPVGPGRGDRDAVGGDRREAR